MQHPSSTTLRNYLEDALSVTLFSEVESHVEQCESCDLALKAMLGQSPDERLGVSVLESSDHLPPDLPGCETLHALGNGGMGIVWKIHDKQFDRLLAVKVIRSTVYQYEDFVRRFRSEAQIISQLSHPSIVPIHSMGELDDGRPFYTMKLVEGTTMADWLSTRLGGPHASGQLQAFLQVCQAVAFAHKRGIIHRDLKPANIMIGEHGEVQVMDWGLAKVLTSNEPLNNSDSRSDALDVEQTQGRMGTAAYMPPEQAIVREASRKTSGCVRIGRHPLRDPYRSAAIRRSKRAPTGQDG